jgi:hypothetical protein
LAVSQPFFIKKIEHIAVSQQGGVIPGNKSVNIRAHAGGRSKRRIEFVRPGIKSKDGFVLAEPNRAVVIGEYRVCRRGIWRPFKKGYPPILGVYFS